MERSSGLAITTDRAPPRGRALRPAAPVVGLVALMLLALAGRCVWLVQTRGDAWRRAAVRQQTGTRTIPARRGEILDCRGRVLATTVEDASVFCDPQRVADAAREARLAAELLGLDAAALRERIETRRHRRFVWVARHVGDAAARSIRQAIQAGRLPGFGVRAEPARRYPLARCASHVLGFVDPDLRGLAGIELAFDQALRGRDGVARYVVDVRRRPIDRLDGQRSPRHGSSVVLTIDAFVQQRLERHLRAAVEKFGAAWGCAIAMDPASGEILAMASVPDFDPADPLAGQSYHAAAPRLVNHAIGSVFEPGSVFKPFVAAEALERGVVRLGQRLAIHGPARRFGRRVIHDTHAYDVLRVREVISRSSNIGMALISRRLGARRVYECIRRFGFGQTTGIALPGEEAGLVHELRRWSGYSLESVAMGQEIAVTPLQLITAFCALANDGWLLRPRIVRGVVDADGHVRQDRSRPEPLRRVVSTRTARRLRREALAEVVRSGTGRQAALSDYDVFGKTGTAQIARSDGRGYEPGAFVASFVGGAPVDDPRLVVLVSIYRPTTGGSHYGGTVAAPTVAAILDETLPYLGVEPRPPRDLAAARGRHP